MNAIESCLAAAAMLALVCGAEANAGAAANLTIRLYNPGNVPASQLSAARTAAETILRAAGLTARFRGCGRAGGPQRATDDCHERLGRGELVVRILESPAFSTTLPADAFGVAYVVKQSDRGWLATVFSDRISAAAARARVNPGTLLGFVMAHEVGHLLLGVDYHGESGIMRADWPDAVLGHRDQWQFSKNEAARIRQAVSAPF